MCRRVRSVAEVDISSVLLETDQSVMTVAMVKIHVLFVGRVSSLMHILRIAVIVFGVFGTSIPVHAGENWPDSLDQYIMQIRKTIETAGMDEFLSAVKNPKGALLLDVREEEEFKAGHVPGTVNIPRGLLEFSIWKQLGYPAHVDISRPIYVQCARGNRAILAARQLKDIGFTNVVAVIMDFREWQKKGNPVVKEEFR
jgi:rhodanese-related sulfurtransferase